jgi:iron complex outermembrane receptor protein
MDEGALGGNINIKTFKPLDVGHKRRLLDPRDLGRRAQEGRSVGLGPAQLDRADETLGLLASGLYDERHVRNDRLYQVGWNLDKFKSVLGRLYTPRAPARPSRPSTASSIRALLTGQWRPNGDFQTDVDLLVTRLDVDYDEFGLDIYPDDTTFQTPAFVAGSQKVVGDTVVGGTINNVRWMASRETSLNRHDLTAFGLKQAWTPGAWSFNAEYAVSRARSYHPDGQATKRNRMAFFGR